MNKAHMKIGIDQCEVDVTFHMSSDGDVEDMTVYYKKVDITGCLLDIQLDDVADQCHYQYLEEAAQNNLDLAIMRKESCV